MEFLRCDFDEIKSLVSSYYCSKQITVDSFWEDHILKSQHYKIVENNRIIGFFAIFEAQMITLFHMVDEFAQHGQVCFEKIKHYEQVTNAFIPTGDEFFLSHAFDNYTKIEKQAYFSVYRSEPLNEASIKNISMRKLSGESDAKLIELADDFFDDGSEAKVINPDGYFEIYLVEDHEVFIGFGIIEYSRIIDTIGSIGMYVKEDKRQQGYAKNILKLLQNKVIERGKSAVSGCWYYNHNSKKSMESAGAFSKTRLLRFYF